MARQKKKSGEAPPGEKGRPPAEDEWNLTTIEIEAGNLLRRLRPEALDGVMMALREIAAGRLPGLPNSVSVQPSRPQISQSPRESCPQECACWTPPCGT